MTGAKHSSLRSSLGAAVVAVALLAPASASADPCAPGTEFTPTYEFVEGRVNVPLVATHELTMIAQFSDRVDHVGSRCRTACACWGVVDRV